MAGRVPAIPVKDVYGTDEIGKWTAVGTGVVNIKESIAAAKEIGVEWMTVEQDRLYAKLPGNPKAEWLPMSATEFFSTDSEITLRFVKDAEGRVNELFVIDEEGESHRGQRIQP